jgi:hypothetical protein
VSATTIKTIDDKGRITLGKEHAGRTVELEESESGIVLRYVVAVPVNEAWLWQNERALTAVRTGIEQAAAAKVGRGPKGLDAALDFGESLPDED